MPVNMYMSSELYVQYSAAYCNHAMYCVLLVQFCTALYMCKSNYTYVLYALRVPCIFLYMYLCTVCAYLHTSINIQLESPWPPTADLVLSL